MNRINALFHDKANNILSIFITAGFPKLDSLPQVLNALQLEGVDMIEIGMPFSDPTADGPTIQYSNTIAIDNGMTLHVLFEQLQNIRNKVNIPLILMGYLNPVLQFGIENFLIKSAEVGIDGVIIPDLPMYEYKTSYKPIFDKQGIKNIFLITPQTSSQRIREIDDISDSFIYAVSTYSITGTDVQFTAQQDEYFQRINDLNLKNPIVMGFGIRDKKSLQYAFKHANGGIIGSSFVKHIESATDIPKDVHTYIQSLK
jgi:tryptophan synthase alpha chain